MRISDVAKLTHRLGYLNVCRVAVHRALLAFRVHPVCWLRADIVDGNFFEAIQSSRALQASNDWKHSCKYFDWHEIPIPDKGRPNWFFKPFTGGADWKSDRSWWQTDSSTNVEGDIKEVWDISRFNWVLAMAQRVANGDGDELNRLNDWLCDWVNKNPPYIGPNWSCGQEASIRVMHLAIASSIMGQSNEPSSPLLSFIRAHLLRIEATLSYALGQDNNHGLLEAAGLFVGGEWLCAATNDPQGKKWAGLGRKWLEERARRLISPDGSFSMYSTSYHREFLDALAICEVWRKKYSLKDFSNLYKERVKQAALWLKAFTNPLTGDMPNIGANDGTRLLPLSDTKHRDFRPSVQMACVLFAGKRAYKDGVWDLPLRWLDVVIPEDLLGNDKSRLFNDSGFAVLRSGSDMNPCEAYIRYPRFRFRPAHPDLMHLDLWVNGNNVLLDAGTFSYNAKTELSDNFSATAAHNTIQFDGDEQMPRLGRFLLAEWPEDSRCVSIRSDEESVDFVADYVDFKSRGHKRSISLTRSSLLVVDNASGFLTKAVLRWRLPSGEWKLYKDVSGFFVRSKSLRGLDKMELYISSDVEIVRAEINTGWESRHYFKKEQINVLEVEIQQPGTLTTKIQWAI